MTAPLNGLRHALRTARLAASHADTDGPTLALLSDKGLAHHHVRLEGTGLLARLPKQSQMGLTAQANLAYEACCFERAGPSGRVPRLFGKVPVRADLPRGGLLVQEIIGRPARLPEDLGAIAQTLAAIHSLPLPPVAQRAPLLSPTDPLASLLQEINTQACYLDSAALDPVARGLIERVRGDFQRLCAQASRPALRLIAFDAHPGNFVVQRDGVAMLVDLEKARYSHPALDLAHATLYTSTTWDLATHAELTPAQVVDTYRAWEACCDLGASQRAWHVPLRAAMWLWSVTWCAKWRVLSGAPAHTQGDGEDWSQDHSSEALVRHVRDRVNCYLGAPAVARVVDELALLAQALR